MLAFVEGGNQRTRRKTFRAWTTVNNKLNPHMKTDLGIEPRPQCGDASILSIVLSLLPWLNQIMLKYSIPMQHHSFFGNLTIYFYYSKGWLPKNRYCSLLDKLHCCIFSLKNIGKLLFWWDRLTTTWKILIQCKSSMRNDGQGSKNWKKPVIYRAKCLKVFILNKNFQTFCLLFFFYFFIFFLSNLHSVVELFNFFNSLNRYL